MEYLVIADFKVNDVYNYMEALSNFNEGDSTIIYVLREEKRLEFQVRF